MIQEFKNLSEKEQELVCKAPVLLSVLVSSSYNEVNEGQKMDAIKLAHLRTFTAPPLLRAYYRDVEKGFEKHFEKAVNEYFPFDDAKRAELEKEISKVNDVIAKLPTEYAQALNQSLQGYARHVKRSAYSVFQAFIFPITFSRLDD